MALLRFDPFRDFDRFAGEAWNNKARTPVLPMDAFRRAHELELQFDLPGVDPATIDVTVEKNILSVSAERHGARREGDEVVTHERPTGRFTRQLRLGEGLDTDKVQATYDAGVLTVTLPVADEVRPRRIHINAGTDGGAIDASVHQPTGEGPAGEAAPTVAA